MKIITRKEALAAALKHYFTGKPCKRGHILERLAANWACIACHNMSAVANSLRSRHTNPRAYLNHKYSNMQERVRGNFRKSAHLYKGLGIMLREEFLAWALADPAFNRLWKEYQVAGRPLKLAPAIDRIDTQRGYVKGNVQFITVSQNSKKACLWRHHGINPIIPCQAAA